MLQNLPERTAVFFGFGRPQFAHICPILAEKQPLKIFVAPEPVVPVVEPLIPAPAVTTVPVEKNSKPKPQPKKTVPVETRNYEDDDMHDYLQEYNNADF